MERQMSQKYKCDNCDDVFYESNAPQASETFDNFDDKDYIICPSCHSSDIGETDEEVNEVYQSIN